MKAITQTTAKAVDKIGKSGDSNRDYKSRFFTAITKSN